MAPAQLYKLNRDIEAGTFDGAYVLMSIVIRGRTEVPKARRYEELRHPTGLVTIWRVKCFRLRSSVHDR
jgi:hypothetical protein